VEEMEKLTHGEIVEIVEGGDENCTGRCTRTEEEEVDRIV